MRIYLVGGLAIRNNYLRPLADELYQLGFSPKIMALPRNASAKEYASVLASKADEPGLWLGHSYGSQLVREVSLSYPDKVTGLILAGIAEASSPQKLVLRLLHDAFYEPQDLVFHAVKSYFLTGPKKFMDEARHSMHLWREDLENPKKPMLVIHGDKDKFTSFSCSHALSKRFDSPLEIVHQAAHGIVYSHPEDVAKLIVQYFLPA